MPNFVIGLRHLMFIEMEASNVESAIKAMNYIDIKDESTDEERA